MTKSINLSNKSSMDYFKKIQLNKEIIINQTKGYGFLAFVSGKSFRNLKRKDKLRIKTVLHKEIEKVNQKRVDELYGQRIVVKLVLFLPRSYLKRVDVDNVAKTVLDLMNKKAYLDDRNVIHLEATKIGVHRKGAISVKINKFEAIIVKNMFQ